MLAAKLDRILETRQNAANRRLALEHEQLWLFTFLHCFGGVKFALSCR